MQKQTPKWLDHFITAFGPKGLVAMAWWAGAFHASRIRTLQQAYPILHITGEAGAGCSTLLEFLWKMAGIDHGSSILLEASTTRSLARYMSGVVDRPVVLETMTRYGEVDFDRFRPCYEGGHLFPQSGSSYENGKFRGALVLVGGATDVSDSKLLASRIVHLHLRRPETTEAGTAAVDVLNVLDASNFADLLVRVHAASDQVAFRLGHTKAYVESMREDMGEALGQREARNHAQIRCLLDLLNDLGLMPDSCAMDAHSEVCEMAWGHVATPF